MKGIDAHLDMAYNAVIWRRDLRQPLADLRAYEEQHPLPAHVGTATVTVPALLEGGIGVVGSSIFVAPDSGNWRNEIQVYHTAEEAHVQAVAQLDYYRRLADEDARVRLLLTADDLTAVERSWEGDAPQLGCFVVMEGADPIREPGEVAWWVERGVRGIGLVWAMGTRYAGGNAQPGPLTAAGRALLEVMAEYHLLLDISHLWEEAAYEVLDRYPGPVVATHANPRAFVETPRQLSDAMIRQVAEREGVVGLIPYNRMLAPGWTRDDPRLSIERWAAAIDHVCQLTGSAAHAGIGSDFDGGFGRECLPVEMDSVADLGQIAPVLSARGYSDADIAAILYGNWLRLFRCVLAH